MFQYLADSSDQLVVVGYPIHPDSVSINLNQGWNWISYVPLSALPVNDALASISPLDGDLIKSQTQFAQYVAGIGWVGNLEFLSAPNGYLLSLGNGGTLTYPSNQGLKGPSIDHTEKRSPSPWTVNPSEFEHTMTLVGVLESKDFDITAENHTVAAFSGNQTRGISEAHYIEALDKWMFFMTIYANDSSDKIDFKLYDDEQAEIIDLDEEITFFIQGQIGSIEEPFVFTSSALSTPVNELLDVNPLSVAPNPFYDFTTLRFDLNGHSGQLVISNLHGQVISAVEIQEQSGPWEYKWDAENIEPGIYIVQLMSNGKKYENRVIKFLKLKTLLHTILGAILQMDSP